MWCREFVAGIMLAGTLGACAAIDSSVAPRYDTVSRSLAEARNESILLNIVRASHDYPLSFSAVSSVIPQMANTTTIGAPQFLLGPNPRCVPQPTCLAVPPSPVRDVIFGNSNNASNSVAIQTQFTLSTQETKDFYNALLRPVDLYVLSYFIRQGYSRELLFWLFLDSTEIKFGAHGLVLGYQFNPPYDYGCPEKDPRKRCFREWNELATITGLSVDEHIEKGEGGKNASHARFCFDKVLALRGQRAMELTSPGRAKYLIDKYVDPGALNQLSPTCGSPWPKQSDPEAAATDTLKFNVGALEFSLVTRSTYGIYQFLGKLLRQSRGGVDFEVPAWVRPEDVRPELSTVQEDHKLLNVVFDRSAGSCFAETQFLDGIYCVPEDGSSNTKRIFGLLAQLLALQTTASDLAITPTVHTVQ
jgi:hypothetical protein